MTDEERERIKEVAIYHDMSVNQYVRCSIGLEKFARSVPLERTTVNC